MAIAGIAAAAALSVATLSSPRFARALGEEVSDGLHGVQTVAAMLALRSPGERPEGALANLKPKHQAMLHERALPKVHGPMGPPTPYEALVAAPPSPVIAPPPQSPPYNVLAGGPPVGIPPTNGAPGTPGGPPFLSNIPTPGGGGGFSPPVVVTAVDTPPTPATPVPEPATWMMMLFGFALVGRALRRNGWATGQPATG